MKTIIRDATASDASSLAALSIEVWLGTYIREGVNGFFADHALREFTADRFRSRLQDQQRTIFVSQNAVGIDGMIELIAGASAPVAGCPNVEIATLYVQPRHQGGGKGVALLQAGLAHARSSGHAGVWLAVNAENQAAIAFYERQSFQNAGETHYEIEDQRYLNYVMRRDL
ncbi:GNAT family N-acetyltransferase [Antarcticirhabdus aurantiaca]|uniref:GNAT family N-acetyltransferase n=1 Tax=Antarcticirhabdus aurantiaca TaxID=2606717 RepID=A0ACD4NVL1_9HYPH|nr:GNAT family N-acetyltransferase [Antarcticirhabdus aurantiaca]WAJ30589.1 GNAT family N-acetyltransferase [Jeongeuplla avenae]